MSLLGFHALPSTWAATWTNLSFATANLHQEAKLDEVVVTIGPSFDNLLWQLLKRLVVLRSWQAALVKNLWTIEARSLGEAAKTQWHWSYIPKIYYHPILHNNYPPVSSSIMIHHNCLKSSGFASQQETECCNMSRPSCRSLCLSERRFLPDVAAVAAAMPHYTGDDALWLVWWLDLKLFESLPYYYYYYYTVIICNLLPASNHFESFWALSSFALANVEFLMTDPNYKQLLAALKLIKERVYCITVYQFKEAIKSMWQWTLHRHLAKIHVSSRSFNSSSVKQSKFDGLPKHVAARCRTALLFKAGTLLELLDAKR